MPCDDKRQLNCTTGFNGILIDMTNSTAVYYWPEAALLLILRSILSIQRMRTACLPEDANCRGIATHRRHCENRANTNSACTYSSCPPSSPKTNSSSSRMIRVRVLSLYAAVRVGLDGDVFFRSPAAASRCRPSPSQHPEGKMQSPPRS